MSRFNAKEFGGLQNFWSNLQKFPNPYGDVKDELLEENREGKSCLYIAEGMNVDTDEYEELSEDDENGLYIAEGMNVDADEYEELSEDDENGLYIAEGMNVDADEYEELSEDDENGLYIAEDMNVDADEYEELSEDDENGLYIAEGMNVDIGKGDELSVESESFQLKQDFKNLFKNTLVSKNDKQSFDSETKGSGFLEYGFSEMKRYNLSKPLSTENSFTKGVPKKLQMQQLERFLLAKQSICRVNNSLFYFDGICYKLASSQMIMMLLRDELPWEVEGQISGMRQYHEVVEYLSINSQIKTFDARVLANSRERNYIAFTNKVVDAKTLNRFSHSKDYPLFFKVNAKYQKHPKETPVFDRFLQDMSGGDKKIMQLVYEIIGYFFLHSNDAKVFVVFGKARNSGKSKLAEFISCYFDEEFLMYTPLQDFGGRFSMGEIENKALCLSMELPNKEIDEKCVGIIKALTGDNILHSEKKFADARGVAQHMKCLFGTNENLKLKKNDDAFWARMLIVPFNYSIDIAQQNKNLLEQLLEERDAIASKAVRAVSGVINRNYEFTIPDESRRMWLEWSQNTDDTFRLIMDGLIEVTGNKQDKLSVNDLYGDYVTEGDKNGYYRMQYPEFQKQMKAVYGLEKRKLRLDGKDNPVSCFEGIRLLRGKHT